MTVLEFRRTPPAPPQEPEDPHLSGRCRCLACGHEWVGVTPVGLPDGLECPSCHLMKGAHLGLAYPAADAWVCNCGAALFFITPSGALCSLCGTRARF